LDGGIHPYSWTRSNWLATSLCVETYCNTANPLEIRSHT
jgi:hypothetical protein